MSIVKRGNQCILLFENLQNLSSGQNTIAIIPETMRPYVRVAQTFFAPTTNHAVRIFIYTDGTVVAYNYSSVTSALNITGSLPYIC